MKQCYSTLKNTSIFRKGYTLKSISSMAALSAIILIGGCSLFGAATITPASVGTSAATSAAGQLVSSDDPVQYKASGDLGTIIERADGSISIINTTKRSVEARIEGLGDLSHASIVYSRNEQFAYVFGRDGGLTKVDILNQNIDKRILQAGNSIGGAISQDGKLVAVSNYTPGGVKVFDAESLELVADIPAYYVDDNGDTKQSKTVGLVDAPGQKFVFSLFEGNQIWIADFSEEALAAHSADDKTATSDMNNIEPSTTIKKPVITKLKNVGKQPYDALISPDGRYYIAGLFGQDGLALVDLWHPDNGSTHILPNYGKGDQRLPVYKMPHLEGWAVAGNLAFVPAVGRHEVLVIDMNTWKQVGQIPVYGQPVFVMARPDGRNIWVNFAFPKNDTLQVIDAESFDIKNTLKPGKAVLHMEFTPRGEEVWVSVRDEDTVRVYNTSTFKEITSLNALKPSGIFFTSRAHRIGL